jgi:hypothetical protein
MNRESFPQRDFPATPASNPLGNVSLKLRYSRDAVALVHSGLMRVSQGGSADENDSDAVQHYLSHL